MAPMPLPRIILSCLILFRSTGKNLPRHRVDWVFAVLAMLLGFSGQLALAQVQPAQSTPAFPYVAYVIEADAYVRSGPGGTHYPTGTLSAGYAVEVFRHDGNDWCAIRPPAGSFSWVDVRRVRPLGDGTAEVVGDQVIARVGSNLSPARSAVQVMLQRGELVKLASGIALPDDRQLAIAAPAGEFRWISARSLSLQPPVESAADSQASPLPAPAPQSQWQSQHAARAARASQVSQVGQANHADQLKQQPPHDSRAGGDTGNAFAHLQTLPNPNRTNESAGSDFLGSGEPPQIIPGSPAAMQLAQFQASQAGQASRRQEIGTPQLPAPTVSAASPTSSATTAGTGNTSPPRIRFRGLSANLQTGAASLDELQLRLSQVVVKEPQLWQFDQLRSEADMLLSQADSTRLRTETRDFLDQITLFEQVRARRLKLGSQPPHNSLAKAIGRTGGAPGSDPFDVGPPVGAARLANAKENLRQRALADLGNRTSKGSNSVASGDDASLADAPSEVRYDAVGKLKPVVSRRKGAPRYALVDEKGGVVSFVTSPPDVNLQPYIGRRIGVNGTRGFMPEYRRAHVTASRVTPLQETVLR